MGVAIGIIIGLAIVAFAIYAVYRGTRGASPELSTSKGESEAIRPRPPVAEFHVKGTEALVYFDVPLPAGEDEVLRRLLLHEAVEIVREKRHTLPIDQVTAVVAFGTIGTDAKRVGSVDLKTPGELPPPAPPPVMFRHVGPDPLASFGAASTAPPPSVSAAPSEAGLTPAGSEVEMSAQLQSGLRMQGVDPAESTAGDLVLGVLRLAGQTISESPGGTGYTAYSSSSPTGRTFVGVEPLGDEDYPELSETLINRFMVDFAQSGHDRGLLVSDRFGPFLMYDKERREPRVHFITRERLQQFVDSVALA